MRALRPIIYLWTFPTTLVGLFFLLPTLITGGRVQIIAGVLEIHSGFTAWFLEKVAGIFLTGGASAMTLGHVVLGRNRDALDRTRAHERVHVRQCERWGPLFLPAYLLASLIPFLRGKDAYYENWFEREAYGEAG